MKAGRPASDLLRKNEPTKESNVSQPMAESIQSRLPKCRCRSHSDGDTHFIWPAQPSSDLTSPCAVMQGLRDGCRCSLFRPAD